jgi:hypothetical protein
MWSDRLEVRTLCRDTGPRHPNLYVGSAANRSVVPWTASGNSAECSISDLEHVDECLLRLVHPQPEGSAGAALAS